MARSSKKNFFDEATPASKTKARMVCEYFEAWASVIWKKTSDWGLNADKRLGYVDLYCGPGKYKDGTASTPLLVYDHILETPELRRHLQIQFNDGDSENLSALISAIDERNKPLRLDERPRHKPIFTDFELQREMEGLFSDFSSVPTLFFIDPFGVKGLTRKLISSLIRNKGSDCIFFFNYSKVNWHLEAEHYAAHIDAIFGPSFSERIRQAVNRGNLSVGQREDLIVGTLQDALVDVGAIKVEPFKFLDGDGSKTSHFLFLATKSPKGEEIWKRIGNRNSTYSNQGIPQFVFSSVFDKAKSDLFQPFLPLGVGDLDDLERRIIAKYAEGTQIKVGQCVQEFQRGSNIMPGNVKKALLNLERDGLITLGGGRRSRTRIQLADDIVISFVRDKQDNG
ncbi:MAG: three-Cys-motif partner protein TcmP [Rhodospirillales bacterium]|nr:three-Cys-motif partner protein TcmP [Rhodospirillales bacterium]